MSRDVAANATAAHRLGRVDGALEQCARAPRPAEHRLEASEVMRDRSPVGAAAAEAIEHDVPVAVRLEEARSTRAPARDRRASPRCRRAPRSRATSWSRRGARSRARRACSNAARARVEVAGVRAAQREHRAVGRDVRVLVGRRRAGGRPSRRRGPGRGGCRRGSRRARRRLRGAPPAPGTRALRTRASRLRRVDRR